LSFLVRFLMLRFLAYLAYLFGFYLLVGLLFWAGHPFILLQPTTLPAAFRYSFSQPFQELTFKPTAGVQLNALWFRAVSQPRQGMVLFFHGNRDNLTRWGREYSTRFTKRGYDVIMYDYRTYGKSTGPRSEAALHDDASYLYGFVTTQCPEDSVVVYGYSLGTGMASRVAANHRPRLLILEAPYANIPTLLHTHAPIYPYEWLTRYKFRTDSCFRHIHCPIQLFHGSSDGVVPYANSRLLLQAPTSSSKVALTTIPKGAHRGLDTFRLYQERLNDLLTKR
jgi:alpha-beta hydrolase superfamily lysophospholipase